MIQKTTQINLLDQFFSGKNGTIDINENLHDDIIDEIKGIAGSDKNQIQDKFSV